MQALRLLAAPLQGERGNNIDNAPFYRALQQVGRLSKHSAVHIPSGPRPNFVAECHV